MNTAMIKQNRALWVEALRSGKYTQGYEYLLRDGEYCVWGVACRTLGVPIRDGDQLVPKEAKKLVGYTGTYFATTLMNLNDSRTPFTALADMIEQSPLLEAP